jgi:hypothetical protein
MEKFANGGLIIRGSKSGKRGYKTSTSHHWVVAWDWLARWGLLFKRPVGARMRRDEEERGEEKDEYEPLSEPTTSRARQMGCWAVQWLSSWAKPLIWTGDVGKRPK